MREHDLKCWPSVFEATRHGDKLFEVRKNTDRDFSAGDILLLRKWDPSESYAGVRGGSYMGKSGCVLRQEDAETLRARVTYILHGGQYGLPPGLCVMSIRLEEA